MRHALTFSLASITPLLSCRNFKSHGVGVIYPFRLEWQSLKSKISQDTFKRATVLESRPAHIGSGRHDDYAAYTLMVNEFNDTVQIIHPDDRVQYKIKNYYSFKNVSMDSFVHQSQLKFINSFNCLPNSNKLYIGYLEEVKN